jgi:hypothetical protein
MSKRTVGRINVQTLATKRPAKVGSKYSLAAIEHILERRAQLNRRERRALDRLTKPRNAE